MRRAPVVAALLCAFAVPPAGADPFAVTAQCHWTFVGVPDTQSGVLVLDAEAHAVGPGTPVETTVRCTVTAGGVVVTAEGSAPGPDAQAFGAGIVRLVVFERCYGATATWLVVGGSPPRPAEVRAVHPRECRSP